jgi:hypothetical protein
VEFSSIEERLGTTREELHPHVIDINTNSTKTVTRNLKFDER